jgi:hypothetical protein
VDFCGGSADRLRRNKSPAGMDQLECGKHHLRFDGRIDVAADATTECIHDILDIIAIGKQYNRRFEQMLLHIIESGLDPWVADWRALCIDNYQGRAKRLRPCPQQIVETCGGDDNVFG